MSKIDVQIGGRVTKYYDSDAALRDVWAWYERRTDAGHAGCVPGGLSAQWGRDHRLTYLYVEGSMPRDWSVAHDASSRYVWGKVLGAGSVPFSAVMLYTDYCMQRAHLLWGPEPEGGKLGTDAGRVVAFRKAMMILRSLRHELHACEDVHGDLTLENCIEACDKSCPKCKGTGEYSTGQTEMPCDVCGGKGGDARIVFLDPGNARGLVCIELDQAKLLQSYDGWETVKSNTAPLHESVSRGVLPPCILPRPYYGRVQVLLLLTHYVRALCHSVQAGGDKHGAVATKWMLQRVDEILDFGGWL